MNIENFDHWITLKLLVFIRIKSNIIFAFDSIPIWLELSEERIVIPVNDEHPKKKPIEVTEEGIAICVNDEHPSKAYSPIEVTEDGIVIVFFFSKRNSFRHFWLFIFFLA